MFYFRSIKLMESTKYKIREEREMKMVQIMRSLMTETLNKC